MFNEYIVNTLNIQMYCTNYNIRKYIVLTVLFKRFSLSLSIKYKSEIMLEQYNARVIKRKTDCFHVLIN